ncbi:MAG: DUF1800 domain-containing protein [Micavibrio sp.]|nr:DUF1800 domain-containing protein [Micavibrio sp.]
MTQNPADTSASLVFMMNRLGYGPRAEDLAQKLTAGNWLEEQLAAPKADEPALAARLARTPLHIKYNASPGKYAAADEMRPLSLLNEPIEKTWAAMTDKTPRDGQEKSRPRDEVIAAIMTRAVYSKYQLREVMTQFWHDHFHVNAYSGDQITTALPAYDRDAIRKNTFGNFRAMLEDVATSTAMQYYLSNHSSRAGSANENFARELFELHTLGRDAYLNDRYDRWKEVPGALDGKPDGYIDQDVYEAARSFTGWTVEDGTRLDGQRQLPQTGKFVYVEKWHDGYQKRVLATEFTPFAAALNDGQRVLDLVAAHPATAHHLAAKLCQRLIGPNTPKDMVVKTAALWMKLIAAPDQVKQVVQFIAQSPEFAASGGAKVRRPLAAMAAFVRVTGMDFTPSNALANQLANAGQKLFGAPTPAGLADDNASFTGSNALRQRWQMFLGLSRNAWENGTLQPAAALARWGRKATGPEDAITEWLALFGAKPEPRLVAAIMDGAGLAPFTAFNTPDGDKHMAAAVAVAALSPSFQTC